MKKINLIVAVCDNGGIGINGDLPWKLKNELRYFSSMTKKVNNPAKRNAVIMGRKTYFGVPESKRPLSGRLNVVLTRDPSTNSYPAEVLVCTTMLDAFKRLDDPELSDDIENVWIVGGNAVYKEAMESPRCHRIYLTEIMKTFTCDTFFPEITTNFKQVTDSEIPQEMQEENGIQYRYKVFEKIK